MEKFLDFLGGIFKTAAIGAGLIFGSIVVLIIVLLLIIMV